jgi:pimeloyl-ACP methyl ester carboxylesterase
MRRCFTYSATACMRSRRISRYTPGSSRRRTSASAPRSRGFCARLRFTASIDLHLVGYSGGGASSLAFAALHGERLLSLALLEPAWAGNERTPAEEALMERFRALEPLPPDQFMAGFLRLQLAPDVEPPPRPEDPPPPWMAKRPAGLRAFIDAFDNGDLDVEALRAFDRPVYFALGGRSNPDYYGRMAERLATIFPDFTLETFHERHHFDPPHRIEPERLSNSLLALWQRAKP